MNNKKQKESQQADNRENNYPENVIPFPQRSNIVDFATAVDALRTLPRKQIMKRYQADDYPTA